MSRQKPQFAERRVLSTAEVAAYLGRSSSWFARHATRLHNSGFPRPLPDVGGYDRQAVDNWLDQLGRDALNIDFEEAWQRATHG